ncbi:MAG: S8/S53 family peptidase [Candidatus Diapherotrites archaeon]
MKRKIKEVRSKKEDFEMENRVMRFLVIAIVVFSAITVFSIHTLLDHKLSNIGLVLNSAVSAREKDSSSLDNFDVIPEVTLDVSNGTAALLYSRIIHIKDTESCFEDVWNWVADHSAQISLDYSDDERRTFAEDKAAGMREWWDPFIPINLKEDLSIREGESVLTQLKKDMLGCLDKAEENDDWNEPEEYGVYALSESIPLVGIDSALINSLDVDSVVCIIDSGLASHLYLPASLIGGYDAKSNKKYGEGDFSKTNDTRGHGTAMAGVVASTHDIYMGAAPGSGLMIARLSKDNPSKKEVLRSIKWCSGDNKLGVNKTRVRADVILIGVQFVEKKEDKPDYDLYNDETSALIGKRSIKSIDKTIKKYTNKEYKKKESITNPATIPVIVPAGNTYPSSQEELGVTKLASLERVISVGAVYDADVSSKSFQDYLNSELYCTDSTTASKQVICLSACGNPLDYAAPGESIMTTTPGAGGVFEANLYGTSLAAAHVAGIISLMKSVNPTLTVDEIRDFLTQSSTIPSGGDPDDLLCYGNGIPNATHAVLLATGYTPP